MASSKKESRTWLRSKKASSPGEKEEYRHKFLSGLQFYCESPSLILNSDLPADLIEFVTSQGFPVQALGVILELKKSSGSGSRNLEGLLQGSLNPQKLAELSRKLAEHWMTSDSCSEAFVSLSLGDEVPGLIAETTNFHRLLFAIPDCFYLSSTEFLKFLLNQCYLAIAAVAYGIRDDNYTGKVRSQAISSFLDRICLRFHSDSEHFYGTLRPENNPFVAFITDLQCLVKEDFIAKRFVTKILLGLGTNSGVKVAKTMFLIGCRDSCSSMNLLSPPEEYLVNSSTWKHILCSSIPLKTPTKSKLFWINWAHFITTSSPTLSELWESCVSNWGSLCSSSAVDCNILIPATYALVALGRELKCDDGEKSKPIKTEAVRVFATVGKCLDSTSEEKKACGMALGQIMGDFLIAERTEGDTEERKPLEFQSSNPVFLELIEYYKVGYVPDRTVTDLVKGMRLGACAAGPAKRLEVLDSDDEIDDDEEQGHIRDENEYTYSGDLSEFDSFQLTEEIPIDQRLLDIRSRKGKLPTYFSEICEVLLEGGGQNKNEYEVEALKYLCIMRIPVLIHVGVRIDANMATSLSRCLMDFNGETSLEVPILFALLELSSLHHYEVFDLISQSIFDKDHYTTGHRMIGLRRLSELVQLLSKTKCFSCFATLLSKNRNELIALCPEFFARYYEKKKVTRQCGSCSGVNKFHSSSSKAEQPPTTSASRPDSDTETLTWREIVDRRLEAKTRYFVTPKRKTPIIVPDEYSSKLVPVLWASVSNRLMSRVNFFTDESERRSRGAGNDMLLAQIFRVLGRIILGCGGPTCPHLRNISAQAGDLVRAFVSHEDARVRQAVIALLAIVVSISDGATYILEAVSGDQNILLTIQTLREKETDPENQSLLDHTSAFLAQAFAIDCQLKLEFPSGVPTKLRILPNSF